MRCFERPRGSTAGAISGGVILVLMLLGVGFVVKKEFFPEKELGLADISGIPAHFGQPISKSTIPRPR